MGNSAGKDSDLPPGSIARTVHRRNLSAVSSSPPQYRANKTHHRLSRIGAETAQLSHTSLGYSSASLDSGSSSASPSRSAAGPERVQPSPRTVETVDYGFLQPCGVYSKPQDYNRQIVRQAIIDRRMAPFYKGKEDAETATPSHVDLYKEAIECPICFLYYPKYINFSRCCMQPICSECFVQIRRPDPHPAESSSADLPGTASEPGTASGDSASSQLVSEPACCPYCQAPDFGVTFVAGPFQAGLRPARTVPCADAADVADPGAVVRARGPVSASDRLVLLTDEIRPDWTAALAAARAYAARKAAAASAIHVTAFMEHGAGSSARLSPRARSMNRAGNVAASRAQREAQHARELEDIMLAEAIRLSLKD